jgi:hypothetical protein
MYPSIKTRGTHLSCILLYKHGELIYHLSSHNKKNLIYHLSFHKNTRYPFIIYPSIKIRGTHLSFILPYKLEELIYHLSSHTNSRNSFIIYFSIKRTNATTWPTTNCERTTKLQRRTEAGPFQLGQEG